MEEINKTSGDVIELKMGYVPPSTILDLDASGNIQEPEPQKYMIYELHRSRSGWYLYAIKDLPGAGLLPGDIPSPIEPMPGDEGASISQIVPELAGNSMENSAASSEGGESDGSSDEGSSDSDGDGEDEGGDETEGDEGEEGEEEDDTSSESASEMQG